MPSSSGRVLSTLYYLQQIDIDPKEGQVAFECRQVIRVLNNLQKRYKKGSPTNELSQSPGHLRLCIHTSKMIPLTLLVLLIGATAASPSKEWSHGCGKTF